MLQLLRIGLIGLLATLLAPAAIVEATCGLCYGAHTCTSNTTFQLCYNGVPYPEHSFSCPENNPICTEYGDICMGTDSLPICGDTSKCAQCSNGEMYACASRTTFGRCDDGVLLPERSPCPTDWFCSVSGAAIGDPCVSRCEPDSQDTCDMVENESGTTTTPDPGTTSSPTATADPSTTASSTSDSSSSSSSSSGTSSATTAAPPFDADQYCRGIQKAGRFAIPNDTDCTSYISCFYRGGVWQANIVSCPAEKPYFSAISACGTVRPTTAGCN
ncbi:uncharacterized protein LOC135430566 [Drosophila montana]|uniref:uncharacterized protein LOC135430566 n=1 Tax=Drosophila montana TaxID=40370 RepID=UPI00313AE9D9